MKRTANFVISVLLALGGLPLAAAAQSAEVTPGSLIKGEGSATVYYVDEDLSRHVFPNGRIFLSWFEDFDGIIVLTAAQLAEFPLAGNVPYKPGKIMVKLQSDPRTYAVDEGGTLRWVKSESAARALYGPDWNRKIHDLSDAFFVDYQNGDDIDDDGDFDQEQGSRFKNLIETLRSKRLKRLAARGASEGDLENRGFGKNKVAVCHKSGTAAAHTIYIAKPALPAHLGHGDAEGRCAGDGQADTTAPTITALSIGSITATSAHALLTANEPVTAKIYLSTTATVDTSASATPKAVAGTAAASHDLTLSGLTGGTLYHYRVVVADAAGNTTTSSAGSFTTLTPDVTAPTLISSSFSGITHAAATLLFTANEAVTAKVYSSTTTPVDVGSASFVTSASSAASHSVNLSGLVASTVYHVRVVFTDAAGNATTSSEMTFTTLAQPDVTAPTILSSSIGSITASSARLLFTADEAVTAKVYSSTTTPVDVSASATATAEAGTAATSHDILLTGLAGGTTYHVRFIAKDPAGNATTSTELSFTTL
jgi:hypothetical protein